MKRLMFCALLAALGIGFAVTQADADESYSSSYAESDFGGSTGRRW